MNKIWPKKNDQGSLTKPKDILRKPSSNIFKIILWAILVLSLTALIAILVFGIGIYRFNWDNKASREAEKIFPYPAAFIGLNIIPLRQLQIQTKYIKFFYNKTSPGQVPSDAEVQKQVIDRMIETVVVKKLCKSYGVTVAKKDVDAEFQKIVDENGGQDKVKQILTDLYGLSVDSFKGLISDQLYRDKLQQKYETDLQERAKVSHILIKIPTENREITVKRNGQDVKLTVTGKEWAQDRAANVLIALKNGEKFADLAKTYSDDESSAKDGGALPFIAKGDTVEEFEKAAFALKNPGDISPVVETQYGLHVIELNEKKGSINMTFDEWLKDNENKIRTIKFVSRKS